MPGQRAGTVEGRHQPFNNEGQPSISVHWICSPSYQGPILLEHCNTPERLDALQALGDLSALAPEIGERHNFHAPVPPSGRIWCLAYGRDRGDAGTRAETSRNLAVFEALAETGGAEYLHLMQGGMWQVFRTPAYVQQA